MHYNPASIKLAAECVRECDSLGAVVVESCESRWRRTNEVTPPGSFARQYLLPSEMQAAADVAEERGVPLSLGDSDVGVFGARVKELAVASLVDLASPIGGWDRLGDDLRRGFRLAFDTEDMEEGASLTFEEFLFDPTLVLGFLVSFARYPAAAAVKAAAARGNS